MSLILHIAEEYPVRVTTLNRTACGNNMSGAGAGTRSLHYANGGGNAVDFGAIGGVENITQTNVDTAARIIERAMQVLPPGSEIGQKQCSGLEAKTTNSGNYRFVTDACNHFHFGIRS